MAFLSLLCSFLVLVTCWLLLPIFILGPLAIYFGWKSYKQTRARVPQLDPARRLLALTPMFIAIATMPATIFFVNATYRA